jgi:uncharacterized membrane protein YqjE
MMGWSDTLIKTLAIAVTPVKLVDKGIDYAKQEVKDEIEKVKILGAMAIMLFMFLIFVSISIALLINYFSDNYYLGFLVMSAVYLLISIILFMVFKKHQKQKTMSNTKNRNYENN